LVLFEPSFRKQFSVSIVHFWKCTFGYTAFTETEKLEMVDHVRRRNPRIAPLRSYDIK